MLKGIVPPLLTPRLRDGRLDEEGLDWLIEHLIAGGVHGIFVLGTTGAGPCLPVVLRETVIRRVCDRVAGRIPIVVGIMDTSPEVSLALADVAADAGAFAIVATPPLFLPLNADQVVDYLSEVAARSSLPVLLYNLPPSLAGSPIPAITLQRLMAVERIIGIKDSSGGMDYLHYAVRLARTYRPDWSVFIGPEGYLAESLLFGASGGVSGGANLYPRLYVDLYDAAVAGDLLAVRRLHDLVLDLGDILFGPPGTSNATGVVDAVEAGLAYLRGVPHRTDRDVSGLTGFEQKLIG